jgi:hypothetical protein
MSIFRKVSNRFLKGKPRVSGESDLKNSLELTAGDELNMDIGVQQSLYEDPIELAYHDFFAKVDQVIDVNQGPILGLLFERLFLTPVRIQKLKSVACAWGPFSVNLKQEGCS